MLKRKNGENLENSDKDEKHSLWLMTDWKSEIVLIESIKLRVNKIHERNRKNAVGTSVSWKNSESKKSRKNCEPRDKDPKL